MTERRTVLRDADGVRRTIITDFDDPNKFVVQLEQDVEEILDGVQRKRDNMRTGGDIRHVAAMPVEIYEMMIRQGWGPDDEAKWLNSSEAAPFRIWKGRV